MGTWGPGIYENDAALDWLGLLDRLGFLAITTPMSAVGEYVNRNQPLPAETEQAFWASCAVIAHAGGLPVAKLDSDYDALIAREAKSIFMLPNLKQRIEFALNRVADAESELDALWVDSDEASTFRAQRDLARERVLKVLLG